MNLSESVIARVRRSAAYGVSTGRDHLPHEAAYYRRCTWIHRHTGTVVMFTRDTGHHTSGWFKNPDYERCLHLSLSFREPRPKTPDDELIHAHVFSNLGAHVPLVPWNAGIAALWVEAVLGDTRKLSWHEGPFSREGKVAGVQHWRVFCDLSWQPIKPRGEVYSRELTAAGWQSWSDQHAEPNWVSAE